MADGEPFRDPVERPVSAFQRSGDREARLLAVTTAPLIFNLFRSEDFVLNNPYTFTDRFSGEESYFGGKGVLYSDRVVETNFVAGATSIDRWRGPSEAKATRRFSSRWRRA